MDDDGEAAARYRERAEEIRIIAGTMTHPKTRASLLTVADDYLLMAATRENVSKLTVWLQKFQNSNRDDAAKPKSGAQRQQPA